MLFYFSSMYLWIKQPKKWLKGLIYTGSGLNPQNNKEIKSFKVYSTYDTLTTFDSYFYLFLDSIFQKKKVKFVCCMLHVIMSHVHQETCTVLLSLKWFKNQLNLLESKQTTSLLHFFIILYPQSITFIYIIFKFNINLKIYSIKKPKAPSLATRSLEVSTILYLFI